MPKISIKFLFLSVACICFFKLYSQPSQINQSALSQVVTAQANQMGRLYKSGDYKGYVKYIHPVIIKAAGGETKMIELLNAQDTQIKNKGIVINGIVFNPPSEIIKIKNELQCTISQHTELKPAKGRIITYTTLIAISTDNGKNWKFIDTSNKDIAEVKKTFPNLSDKITLPPKQKPTVYPI